MLAKKILWSVIMAPTGGKKDTRRVIRVRVSGSVSVMDPIVVAVTGLLEGRM